MTNKSIVKYLQYRADCLATLGEYIKAAELLAIARKFEMELK